jgi:predicted Rossmann fold flavoprotein
MKKFDLVIIGGGAAGMIAAISARRHHPDFKIAIVDRTFALGRKILVCGAGRCNITNLNLDSKVDSAYYGASDEFVHSVFDQFGFDDIVKFFNELGIELYVERKTNLGKLFPITDQAKTVTELLLDEIERSNIEVLLNTEVKSVNDVRRRGDVTAPSFQIDCSAVEDSHDETPGFTGEIQTEYLILSAGGKSYPALGSNGSGYDLAASFGHNIIQPIPAALPLEGANELTHFLQGQKMEIEATSIIEGKEIKTSTDDVFFKNYGLSGPAILNISREVSIHFNRENNDDCFVKLNFFPGKSAEDVTNLLKERWQKRPNQEVYKSLFGLFPNKIAKYLVKFSGIDENLKSESLNKAQINHLVDVLTNTRIRITGTRGWNEAEFTAGGVNSTELKFGTMESKLQDKFYICGEIVDVDGDVGGFNLSWSWASGFVAGKLQ